MTSPMKHQSCFDVPDGQPEVTFGFKHVSIPRTQIERRAAQACKQFSAALVPDPLHFDNSMSPSTAGSINQQTDGKVMESFTPQKRDKEWLRAFRERCQENLSLYFRRRAAKQRGFVGELADTLSCSDSKASKLTYGEANPHWTDPVLFALQQDGLVPYLREVFGEEYVDAALKKEALRILSEMLERAGE